MFARAACKCLPSCCHGLASSAVAHLLWCQQLSYRGQLAQGVLWLGRWTALRAYLAGESPVGCWPAAIQPVLHVPVHLPASLPACLHACLPALSLRAFPPAPSHVEAGLSAAPPTPHRSGALGWQSPPTAPPAAAAATATAAAVAAAAAARNSGGVMMTPSLEGCRRQQRQQWRPASAGGGRGTCKRGGSRRRTTQQTGSGCGRAVWCACCA